MTIAVLGLILFVVPFIMITIQAIADWFRHMSDASICEEDVFDGDEHFDVW